MSFFDFNCMLGPTMTDREPSLHHAEDLLREMDRLGIDEALVYASASRFSHPLDGNEWISDVTAGQPRLHPCWVGLPPGTGELGRPESLVEQMQGQGVRALRLLPVAHRFPVLEESLRPLLGALGEADIPLLLDVDRGGWSEISLDWREVFEISRRHPRLPLVLMREGGSTARVLFETWADHPNIYLDASYIQESRIVPEIAERFGADRLLFGSAMPKFDAGGALASVQGAALTETDRAAIAGNNARRLLGLPTRPVPAQPPVWPFAIPRSTDGSSTHGSSTDSKSTEIAGAGDGPTAGRSYRVFDTHGHLGRWGNKYYSDWSGQQMVDYMDQLGIERFCVSDLNAIGSDIVGGNNRVGAAVAQFPDRIHGYAVYNPNYESRMAAEMARCFDELGCSGIKLHCALHETATMDPRYRLAYQTAHERKCPVLCHTSHGPDSAFFKEMLSEFPDCQFIYAHVGGAFKALWEPLVEAAQQCPNFFLELSLSVMPRNGLVQLLEHVPASQVLYGSDHPLNDFTYQLGRVQYADIAEDDKQKILWDNAARIFNVS